MKISNDTSISMPIKNMLAIVAGVAMGVFAYTEVTSRLTSLLEIILLMFLMKLILM